LNWTGHLSYKAKHTNTVSVHACVDVYRWAQESVCACASQSASMCVWLEKWRRVECRWCLCAFEHVGKTTCVSRLGTPQQHNTIRNNSNNNSSSIWKFWNQIMKCLGKFHFRKWVVAFNRFFTNAIQAAADLHIQLEFTSMFRLLLTSCNVTHKALKSEIKKSVVIKLFYSMLSLVSLDWLWGRELIKANKIGLSADN